IDEEILLCIARQIRQRQHRQRFDSRNVQTRPKPVSPTAIRQGENRSRYKQAAKNRGRPAPRRSLVAPGNRSTAATRPCSKLLQPGSYLLRRLEALRCIFFQTLQDDFIKLRGNPWS